jgi:hypothetical protein
MKNAVAGASSLKETMGGAALRKGWSKRVSLEPAAPELCKNHPQISIKFIHVIRYFNIRLSTIRGQNDHPYVSSISTTGWTIENLSRRDCIQGFILMTGR